jgi:hypothetical protein
MTEVIDLTSCSDASLLPATEVFDLLQDDTDDTDDGITSLLSHSDDVPQWQRVLDVEFRRYGELLCFTDEIPPAVVGRDWIPDHALMRTAETLPRRAVELCRRYDSTIGIPSLSVRFSETERESDTAIYIRVTLDVDISHLVLPAFDYTITLVDTWNKKDPYSQGVVRTLLRLHYMHMVQQDAQRNLRNWSSWAYVEPKFDEYIDKALHVYGTSPLQDQPDGLDTPLHEFQLRTVRRMLDAENADIPSYCVPFFAGSDMYWDLPRGRLVHRDSIQGYLRGGMVCNSVGSGKTVTTLGLCLAAPGKTLIVCPSTLLGQWSRQITQHAPTLGHLVFYGNKRPKTSEALDKAMEGADVVLTTTKILQDEINRQTGIHLLRNIQWRRIVIDESHELRGWNMNSLRNFPVARAVWFISASPCVKALGDIRVPLLHLGPGAVSTNTHSFNHLVGLHFMGIRECISMDLPPLHEHTTVITLTGQELGAYEGKHLDAMYRQRSAALDRDFIKANRIQEEVRVLCSSGQVVPVNLPVVEGYDGYAFDPRNRPLPGCDCGPCGNSDDEYECSICLEGLHSPLVTGCSHWFCMECILQHLASGRRPVCPLCRASLAAKKMHRPACQNTSGPGESSAPAPQVIIRAKVDALLRDVETVLQTDSRILVFSHYQQTLDVLRQEMGVRGIETVSISGGMTAMRRSNVISKFESGTARVFLLNMRTGGVGINLYSANHVFLMEPGLSAALETQAIGRAWRQGQARPVHVTRYVIENSIETRVVEWRESGGDPKEKMNLLDPFECRRNVRACR